MNPLLRLFVLSLLLSLPAAAQTVDPWAPEEESPDALEEALAQPSPERWTPAGRIGAELGGGLLGMLGGGVAGGGVGVLVGFPMCGRQGWYELCVAASGVLGASAGGLIGLPLGIHWGGQAAGANGSGWAAAGGAALGAAAFVLAASTQQEELLLPAAVAIPLLGVLGYELSDLGPEEAMVTPALALGPQGGSLALSGRF